MNNTNRSPPTQCNAEIWFSPCTWATTGLPLHFSALILGGKFNGIHFKCSSVLLTDESITILTFEVFNKKKQTNKTTKTIIFYSQLFWITLPWKSTRRFWTLIGAFFFFFFFFCKFSFWTEEDVLSFGNVSPNPVSGDVFDNVWKCVLLVLLQEQGQETC